MSAPTLRLPTEGRRSPEEVARRKAIERAAADAKATEEGQIAEQVALAADPVLIAAGWTAEDWVREWTDPPDFPIDPRDLGYWREIDAGPGLDHVVLTVDTVRGRFVDEGRQARRDWRVEGPETIASGSATEAQAAARQCEQAAADLAVAILAGLPEDVRREALGRLSACA